MFFFILNQLINFICLDLDIDLNDYAQIARVERVGRAISEQMSTSKFAFGNEQFERLAKRVRIDCEYHLFLHDSATTRRTQFVRYKQQL
jgi:hypothetical protein